MSNTLLTELKKLQHERSDSSPFKSHIEFLKWADQVAALLYFDDKQKNAFKRRVSSACASQSLGSSADAISSINQAIGIVNEVITSLEIKNQLSQPPTPSDHQQENRPTHLEFPAKITLKWIYEHTPYSFYSWLFGLLFAAFSAGIVFTETHLYLSLKNVVSKAISSSTAVRSEAGKSER